VLRVLAPLALVAALVAVVVVVSSSGGDEEPPARSGQGQARQSAGGGGSGSGGGAETPKTYVVEPGDSLGTIAETFGVSVKRIERLNKGIDPNTLATGQELTLRE
jgi:teichoic acid transport system ATP-binding protein